MKSNKLLTICMIIFSLIGYGLLIYETSWIVGVALFFISFGNNIDAHLRQDLALSKQLSDIFGK